MGQTVVSASAYKASAYCHHCGAELREGQWDFCCSACEEIARNSKEIPAHSRSASFEHDLQNYSYLDEESYKKKYVFNEHEMLFYVEGLHCSSCVHLLEQLPSFHEDIQEARVNFGDSTVWVSQAPGASWAQVAAIIKELGYQPSPLSPLQNSQAEYQKENREFLKRLAVAGACAGNIMLFVIPVYGGLAGTWGWAFNGMSFLLFLPILFYSAKPFYQGAWNFLKYRTVNVDLPIVVALWSGFLLSTYNLIRREGPVYYDSTASFLFLILASRYLLRRVQQKYLQAVHHEQMISPEVQVGDILEVHQGQKIPVDGTLLSPTAEIDLSLFNGESLPQVFRKGMEVFAGTVLLSSSARLRVSKTDADTRLGRLMALLRSDAVRKTPFTALTDKLAQALILIVFGTALIYFAWTAPTDLQKALQRSLALIVVACPCALAFGAPLAYGLAVKKARKLGITLKNGEVLERLLKVRSFFFDKTGTLTEGRLTFTGCDPCELSHEEKSVILAMEETSFHPVAFALRRAWQDVEELPVLEQRREILGRGVEGVYKDQHYSLTAANVDAAPRGMTLEFRKNNSLIALLHLQDQLREDSAEVLQSLQGFQLTLLSGDSEREVREIAQKCGFPASRCHAGLSPEQKLSWLKSSVHTCMIGDGANDSLALKAADVGIAVKGSVDLSLASADVYFMRGGLSPLLDLLNLAHQTRQTLRRNLWISLGYNTLGGVLALGGYINPMVAAILMPISSALLVISSVRGMR